MTGDELERAIKFLLESQAKHDARMAEINEHLARSSEHLARSDEQLVRVIGQVEQLKEQQAETAMMVREYTAMQSELVQVMTRTFDSQLKINDSFRAEMREGRDEFRAELKEARDEFRAELKETRDEFRAELKEASESFRETLDRLAAIVERHVSDGHGGSA